MFVIKVSIYGQVVVIFVIKVSIYGQVVVNGKDKHAQVCVCACRNKKTTASKASLSLLVCYIY